MYACVNSWEMSTQLPLPWKILFSEVNQWPSTNSLYENMIRLHHKYTATISLGVRMPWIRTVMVLRLSLSYRIYRTQQAMWRQIWVPSWKEKEKKMCEEKKLDEQNKTKQNKQTNKQTKAGTQQFCITYTLHPLISSTLSGKYCTWYKERYIEWS